MIAVLISLALIALMAGVEVARQFNARRFDLMSFREHPSIFYPFYFLGWFMTYPLHRAAKEVNPAPFNDEAYFKQVEAARAYVEERAPDRGKNFRVSAGIAAGAAINLELTSSKREADQFGIDPNAHLRQRFSTDDPIKFMCDLYLKALDTFDKHLPPYVRNEGTFTAAAEDILPNSAAIDAFYHVFKRDEGTPPNDKCLYREYMAYQESWYACRKKVDEREYEKDSHRYYEDLLRYSFEYMLFQSLPVSIPQEPRMGGTWVIAPQGSGKTYLLSALLKPDLDAVRDGKASVICMDAKGQFADAVMRLTRFAPGGDLAGKLTLIQPSETLSLNPLKLSPTTGHTFEMLEYLFSFGAESSPQQSTLMRFIVLALLEKPDANFADLFKFLLEGKSDFIPYIDKLKPSARDFFLKPTIKGASEFDSPSYGESRVALARRVRDLTSRVPLLEGMMHARETRFKLGEQMDEGRVIVLDVSQKLLGESGSEFLGRLFLSIIYGEAMQGREHKKPVYVYMDDCHYIIKDDENVNKIITLCRSNRIGLTLSHQKLIDINSPKVKAALRDCSVRIGQPDEEASELAHRFRTTAERLQRLKEGQFAVYIRKFTHKALFVNVPPDPAMEWDTMSDGEFQEIRRAMREKYCFTPEPDYITPPPQPPAPLQPEPSTAPGKWKSKRRRD